MDILRCSILTTFLFTQLYTLHKSCVGPCIIHELTRTYSTLHVIRLSSPHSPTLSQTVTLHFHWSRIVVHPYVIHELFTKRRKQRKAQVEPGIGYPLNSRTPNLRRTFRPSAETTRSLGLDSKPQPFSSLRGSWGRGVRGTWDRGRSTRRTHRRRSTPDGLPRGHYCE